VTTMHDMTPSHWLFDTLKAHIGFRPTAYRAHRSDLWVIGYGHTGAVAGAAITMDEAEHILRLDMERVRIEALRANPDIGQGRLDVLVALGCAK
jgi:GH24 family phage-related lysozyme (muramidase)